MHIGILTAKLNAHSGWEHYGLALIEALQALNVRVTAVVPHNSDVMDGIEVQRLLPDVTPMEPRFLLKLARCYPAVQQALRECDLIHNIVEVYAPLAATVAGPRPHIMTVHGSYARYPHVRGWPIGALYAWAYRQATMVCVSHYTEHILQQGIPDARTVVINNAVDAAHYVNLPQLGVTKQGPTIVTAGGVKTRKGTLELVRAVAVVRETIPDVQCVVLGSTETEKQTTAQVRAEVERLGLQDTVHLMGFVPDDTLRAWYGAADVFVLPSMNDGWKFEGFGLVHLEASAAGLPVIGTDNSGVVDAIDHNVTGLIVSQEYVAEALPEAIIALLRDPVRARRMGEAGRQKAQQQSWMHMAQQMVALYETRLYEARLSAK